MVYPLNSLMVQEILTHIKTEISAWLEEKGVSNPVILLERSAEVQFGEYSSNVAMRYAKELSQSPLDIGAELALFLQGKNIPGLDRVE